MDDMRIRGIRPEDRYAVAELIYTSLNFWYATHGKGPILSGGPATTEVFYDVYEALDPGCAFVAENVRTGAMMGSCFYHPRERHVSLGIMNVHPNYFGHGVARDLLSAIIDYTDSHGYKALRLTQSALNLDSFSLYNRAGFVPRCAFQDMFIRVPSAGFLNNDAGGGGIDKVRDATPADVPGMAELELAVSGITREKDYRYCIENAAGYWHVGVYEGHAGQIDGFIISCRHPAMNMLGPCVARTDQQAIALIGRELSHHRGLSPVFLVPVEREKIVHQMYDWGARNCELHFCQVRGEFRPFQGISMPSFLPETA